MREIIYTFIIVLCLSHVTLARPIYDIPGREISTPVKKSLKPGTYGVEQEGSNYPSGIYFYKLTTESFSQTKRMVLIK